MGRKNEWKCTEPVKEDGKIKYEIYRLDTVICCETTCSMKIVKANIKKTLDRMNFKTKQGYT